LKKIEPIYADPSLKIESIETEREKQILYRKNDNLKIQKIVNAPIIKKKKEGLTLLNLKDGKAKNILDQLDFRNAKL